MNAFVFTPGHHQVLRAQYDPPMRRAEEDRDVIKESSKWTMWLDKEQFKSSLSNLIQLVLVTTQQDWDEMFNLRRQIEIPYLIGFQLKSV